MKSKYEKYITTQCITPPKSGPPIPVLSVHGDQIGNVNWSAFWCTITAPVIMEKAPMTHDFDQTLVFMGGNPLDINDFQAEVELYLGEEQELYLITQPTVVHVPAGLWHAPINFKRIDKPIMFWYTSTTPSYTRKVLNKK